MKKINTFIDIAMLILVCVGIIFGTWSDNQATKYFDSGLSLPGEFCAHDRLQTFLMVITSFWFGINLLFKPYSFMKNILGMNWFNIRIAGLFLLVMSMLGLFLVVISMLGLWQPYFINCL